MNNLQNHKQMDELVKSVLAGAEMLQCELLQVSEFLLGHVSILASTAEMFVAFPQDMVFVHLRRCIDWANLVCLKLAIAFSICFATPWLVRHWIRVFAPRGSKKVWEAVGLLSVGHNKKCVTNKMLCLVFGVIVFSMKLY